jgi:hypothetical protein
VPLVEASHAALVRVTVRVRAVPAAVALVLAAACSGPAADSQSGEPVLTARPAALERGEEAAARVAESRPRGSGLPAREGATFAEGRPSPDQAGPPAPAAAARPPEERIATHGGMDAARLAAVAPVPEREPASLMGLVRDQIVALLGTPSLVRRDAPAEVWQYAGEKCVLDLYLYEGGDGAESGGPKSGRASTRAGGGANAYRVTYLEARGLGGGAVSEQSCLNRLLAVKRAAKPG